MGVLSQLSSLLSSFSLIEKKHTASQVEVHHQRLRALTAVFQRRISVRKRPPANLKTVGSTLLTQLFITNYTVVVVLVLD